MRKSTASPKNTKGKNGTSRFKRSSGITGSNIARANARKRRR